MWNSTHGNGFVAIVALLYMPSHPIPIASVEIFVYIPNPMMNVRHELCRLLMLSTMILLVVVVNHDVHVVKIDRVQ